jgi:hypothetical protein
MGDFAGITEGQRRRAYRRYVEEPIRAGTLDSILERVVQGSREFRAKMLELAKGGGLTGKRFRSERLVWAGRTARSSRRTQGQTLGGVPSAARR